jgi:hypothetical protein
MEIVDWVADDAGVSEPFSYDLAGLAGIERDQVGRAANQRGKERQKTGTWPALGTSECARLPGERSRVGHEMRSDLMGRMRFSRRSWRGRAKGVSGQFVEARHRG